MLRPEMLKLLSSNWNQKNCCSSETALFISIPGSRKGKETDK